jgi:hypothetical protein
VGRCWVKKAMRMPSHPRRRAVGLAGALAQREFLIRLLTVL